MAVVKPHKVGPKVSVPAPTPTPPLRHPCAAGSTRRRLGRLVREASVTFAALGTTGLVATQDGSSLEDAQRAVAREIAAIDAACSRFRADSELMRVNASPGRFVPVSDLFCAALLAALTAAVSTAGLVDPTVGESLLSLGYRSDFTSSPPPPEPAFRVATAGRWREIEIDAASGRVRIPVGVRLDLGATAKALAADRAVAVAAAKVDDGVLVSLGGDISVAGPARDRLGRARDRRPSGTRQRRRSDDRDQIGGSRHVEHHRARLERGGVPSTTSWTPRAGHLCRSSGAP